MTQRTLEQRTFVRTIPVLGAAIAPAGCSGGGGGVGESGVRPHSGRGPSGTTIT